MQTQTDNRPNVAVVLAAGTGSRMQADRPKQYLTLGGRMVVEHSIEAFERHADISETVIIVAAGHIEEMRQLTRRRGWQKVRHILPGGTDRSGSSLAAIRAYTGRTVNLLFHDAARPLVTQHTITAVCRALREYPAACAALPAVDTMAEIHNGCISRIPPRERMVHLQTPQGFRAETIARAYGMALADPDFRATDDCGVMTRYLPEEKIKYVEGSARAVKLTFASDTDRLEKLLLQPE